MASTHATMESERWHRILVCPGDSFAVEDIAPLTDVVGSDVELTLLNVVPVPYALPAGVRRAPVDSDRAARAAARARARGDRLESVVVELEPRAEVLERAGELLAVLRRAMLELQPDLVVVGADAAGVVEELVGAPGATPIRRPCDVLVLGGRRGIRDAVCREGIESPGPTASR